jgi:predicted site-specific integrase-resolvase
MLPLPNTSTKQRFAPPSRIAAALGVAERTAREWAARGLIPVVVIAGRRLVDLERFEALIAAQRESEHKR